MPMDTTNNDHQAIEPSARPHYTLAELLAEAEAAGTYPLPPEEREWVDAPPVGKEWPNDEGGY